MGLGWVSVEERIDQMLRPLSDVAIERANAQPGERIIDVGCGCGPTSFALAETGADVHGVDISTPMIDQANKRYDSVSNLHFSVMDAATADYTADHQCIFSRFGVMFFADPVGAFTNIRTALVPAGRLAVLCWKSPQDNPWISTVGAALQEFQPDAPAPDPNAPNPFAFADEDYVHDVFGSAGFKNIEIETVTRELHLGDSIEEAMIFQTSVGPLSGLLASLSEDDAKHATEKVVQTLEGFMTRDGLNMGAVACVIRATAN